MLFKISFHGWKGLDIVQQILKRNEAQIHLKPDLGIIEDCLGSTTEQTGTSINPGVLVSRNHFILSD